MAFTDYASFRTEVATWLNDSSLGTAQLDSLIAIGEDFVYKDIDLREQEASLDVTITSTGSVALPTDYHNLKYAYIDAEPVVRLQRKTPEWIWGNYPYRGDTGKPKFIARENGSFIFGPAPDSTYTVKGIYCKQPTLMSTAQTVNGVVTAHPSLFLFGTLIQAEPYIGRDERIKVWQAMYDRFKKVAQEDYDDEVVSGGPLAMTAA